MIKYLTIALLLLVGAYAVEIALLTKGGDEIVYPIEAYEKAPRPIKTLILGHCEAASGIAPAYLGKNVFNFAANDRNFFYTRKFLEQVIKKSEVESVVLAVSSLMIMGRYKVPTYTKRYLWLKKGIIPPSEDIFRVAFSFGNHAKLLTDTMNDLIYKKKIPVNYHLHYSPAFTSVPLQEIKNDTYYMDGFRALTPSYEFYPPGQLLDEVLNNVDLSQTGTEREDLFEILSILKNSSIKTTLVMLPQVKGFKDQIEKRVPGTEAKFQETLSNIRKQFPDVRIHDFRLNHGIPDRLFALPYIISSKGADIFGPQLAKMLNEQNH